jgi:hypothetical protein
MTRPVVVLDPLFGDERADAMVDLCERFGRYRMYAEHEQIETDVPEFSDDDAFRGGKAMVVRYRVTPRKPGLRKMTLLASAYEFDDAPGPVTAGAKDARTFRLSEATPAVAAR